MTGESKREKLFFNIYKERYKGNKPFFYDAREFPWGKILEDHYEIIRQEIMDYMSKQEIKTAKTPYNYRPTGWKTATLYTYLWKYHKTCKNFPETVKLLNQIPGFSLASVNVLQPRTTIKAHYGDSNAIIRCHLGISIPAQIPVCGIRVGTHEKSWEEGKTFAFCDAHRHRAWNLADEKRVVLIVDVIREEYLSYRFLVCGLVLANLLMTLIATRFPLLKKMPVALVKPMHHVLGFLVSLFLPVQRNLPL